MLIRELLSQGVKQFGRSLEVELVLAHVLGMSRSEVIAHDDIEVTSEVSIKLFQKYIDELVSGKPLAYIVRSKEFYGADFYVDERVLVPRPETEMIVDIVLEYLNERAFAVGGMEAKGGYYATVNKDAVSVVDSVDLGKDFKILDIGTGSGCIIASILKNFDNAVGVACDISRDALEVARENFEYHNLEDRVELVESDLFEAFDEGGCFDKSGGSGNGEFFDVIVTNPPYVAEVSDGEVDSGIDGEIYGVDDVMASGNFTADENVAKHEPGVALFAGKDGMDVYKKLVQQLIEKRIDFNLLVGEFGAGQKDAILELLSKNFIQTSGISNDLANKVENSGKFEIEIKNDLAGIPRIFIVRKV